MVQKSTMTKEAIFEMLEDFPKYYDVMEPEDKKSLLRAVVISSIEIYNTPKGKRADSHLIKTIHFTFPVTYDGESEVLFISSTGVKLRGRYRRQSRVSRRSARTVGGAFPRF